MASFTERINQALEQAPGVRQADLARACGISTASVNNWFSGATKSLKGSNLLKVASMLNVSPDWLATGKGPMKTDSLREPVASYAPAEATRPAGLVPLISSVQAGEWCDIVDHFQPGDAEEWYPCPVRHGPNTFCLTVEGESMRNPGGKPSYEPGDIIFVDPDVALTPGARAVFRLEGQTKATFKQYIEEDGRKLLKALNPEWSPRYIEINGHTTVCGVVIGKWVPE